MSGTADWSPPLRISLNVLKCKRQRSLVVCQDTVIGGLSLGPPLRCPEWLSLESLPTPPGQGQPHPPAHCPPPSDLALRSVPSSRKPADSSGFGLPWGTQHLVCRVDEWGVLHLGVEPGSQAPWAGVGLRLWGRPGFGTGTPPGKGSQRPALLGPSHTGCRPRWEAPPPRRLVEPAAQAVALEREGGDHGRGEGCCFSRAPGEGERQRVPSTTSEEDDTP